MSLPTDRNGIPPNPRPVLDLTVPGALIAHDAALRNITTAVVAAMHAGATDKDVLRFVVAPLLNLSLLGPHADRIVEVTAQALEQHRAAKALR